MCDKDPEFKFNLQTFIHKNSSVNGIVTDGTVTSFYDMILDHARGYVTAQREAAKALQEKQNMDGCFGCGAKCRNLQNHAVFS